MHLRTLLQLGALVRFLAPLESTICALLCQKGLLGSPLESSNSALFDPLDPPSQECSPIAQFLCNVSPFRMNTCKSVSKQRTLTTFRMNTYEKHTGWGRVSWFQLTRLESPKTPSRICLSFQPLV